jgi:UDP-N-acetylglucosamine--dolichyl-phosphate N-acetylglucosaminephosphotransferase
MTVLGILDDIFDIRWRHKVLLPAIASIPLLVVYYVDFNVTVVVTPTPLLPYLPRLINLGRSDLMLCADIQVGYITFTWPF